MKTYVFTPNGYSRCIDLYVPENTSSNKLPVLISVNGYGEGTLSPFSGIVQAANYYGFAVIGYVSYLKNLQQSNLLA